MWRFFYMDGSLWDQYSPIQSTRISFPEHILKSDGTCSLLSMISFYLSCHMSNIYFFFRFYLGSSGQHLACFRHFYQKPLFHVVVYRYIEIDKVLSALLQIHSTSSAAERERKIYSLWLEWISAKVLYLHYFVLQLR